MKVRTCFCVFLIFAVVVVGCAGPKATPTPKATATPAPRSISGRISYAGSALAKHKIIVVAGFLGEAGTPAYSTIISSVGPYTITNVADSTYTIFAFIDLGDDMGSPQPDEPSGWYDPGDDGSPDPVTIREGNPVTGVDITIRDQQK